MISLVVEVDRLSSQIYYSSCQVQVDTRQKNTEKTKRKSGLFWDTLPPVALDAIRFSNVGLRLTLMAPT